MGKTLQLKKGLTLAALAFLGTTATWADSTALIDADFSTYAGTDGWTAVDKSTKTGTTWAWASQTFSLGASGNYKYVSGVKIQSDWYAKHDDYYVSKAVQLTAGSTYTLTTSTGKTSGTDGVLTIEVGTSAEDMSTYKSIKTLTPVNASNALVEETTTFTAETSGTYYFAYHAVSTRDNASDYFYLFNFKVEGDNAGGGTTEPTEPTEPEEKSTLEADFSTQAGTEGWSAIDKSTKTDVTWEWYNRCFSVGAPSYDYISAVRLKRDWDALHNDYFVSPSVELKGGKTYIITTKTGKQENTTATLTLELGTSASDVSTFKSIKTLTPTVNYNQPQEETMEYTPETDGTYYFAYHGVEETSANDYLFLFSFKVATKDEGGTDPDPDQPVQPGDNNEVYSTDMASDPSWTSLLSYTE